MTEKEVKDLLYDKWLWFDDFLEFMEGQTVGLDEDGSTDFYEDDVWRFINWREKNIKPTFD